MPILGIIATQNRPRIQYIDYLVVAGGTGRASVSEKGGGGSGGVRCTVTSTGGGGAGGLVIVRYLKTAV